jgi:hypothetical protein
MLDHEIADPPPHGLPLLAAAEVQDDLLVASNDLDRLQRLLSDASDSLLAHFHGAAQALQALQALQTLRRDATAPATGLDAPQLERSLAHVAGAITAMQFQDMAHQLIAHTTQRLRSCADRLAREALGDDDDGAAVVECPPLRPNPVTQDEMDAGSIELF